MMVPNAIVPHIVGSYVWMLQLEVWGMAYVGVPLCSCVQVSTLAFPACHTLCSPCTCCWLPLGASEGSAHCALVICRARHSTSLGSFGL